MNLLSFKWNLNIHINCHKYHQDYDSNMSTALFYKIQAFVQMKREDDVDISKCKRCYDYEQWWELNAALMSYDSQLGALSIHEAIVEYFTLPKITIVCLIVTCWMSSLLRQCSWVLSSDKATSIVETYGRAWCLDSGWRVLCIIAT